MDNAAATPVDGRVQQEMARATKLFGNPSSFNDAGRAARTQLDKARLTVARFLGAQPREIIFTASGSEANSLALKSFSGILTTPIEHVSVLRAAPTASMIKVNGDGLVDLKDFEHKLKAETELVSVMYANNEIGTIEPIIKIGKVIKKFRRKNNLAYPYFHVDACQATEYLLMNVNQLGVDILSFNGTKIYGPRGIGVLYVRRGVNIKPLVRGGNQEFSLRAGTENLPAIVGLAKAISLIKKKEGKRLTALRDYFLGAIKNNFPKAKINGTLNKDRLPNNISVSFPNVDIERILLELDKHGIRAGSGSACTARDVEPSHVLVAIGNEKKYLHALRFSMGRQTTKKEVNFTLGILKTIEGVINELD